jgi:hypothetical protein
MASGWDAPDQQGHWGRHPCRTRGLQGHDQDRPVPRCRRWHGEPNQERKSALIEVRWQWRDIDASALGRRPTGKNGIHIITDEQKRQFGELSMDFLETLQRDGDDRNLDRIIDQWEALEKKIGRVVCYDEILSWFSGFRFEQPVMVH